MSEQQPVPVDLDANATVEQLLARAAQDLGDAVIARLKREGQGGTETREGIIPGGGC